MAEEIIPVLDVDLPATPAEDEGVQTVEDAEWVDPFLIKHLNQVEYTGSGSGNYFSFLRINAKDGVAEGVNTDAAPLPLDDNGPDQNNALKLSQIPIVVIDGVEYYEIRLDVNEPNSTTNELSLSEIQLFLSTQQATSADVNADRSVTALDGDFTKVFDLDATTDKTLILRDDYSGSGRDDYILYIPVSQVGSLTGVTASNTFVSLYVQFGPTPEDDAGFEEFRVRSSVVVNGVKFADIDGDGVRDTGEGGIGGIKVFLDLDGNGVLSTGDRVTTTAADGSFEFTGLPTSTVSQSYFVYELLTAEQAGQYILTTGNAQGGHLVTISSTGNVSSLAIGNMPIIKDISVVKSVTSIVDGPDATGGNALDGNGDTINYLVSITNTGNVPLTNVNVGDLLEGGIALTLTPVSNGNGDTVLNVGETWTFSASYVLTQADLDTQGGGNGLLDNVATGSAQYNGQTVGPKSDDEHTPLVYNPVINVTKDVKAVDAAGNLLADKAGDVIDYTIKIANTGNITLTGVAVTDTVEAYGATVATYASGDADGDGKLDVGETWTFDASYTLTQDDLDGKGGGNSLLDNVGTGDTAQTDPDSDSETVPLVYDPKMEVTKDVSSVTGGTAGKADSAGDIINYAISVANTGNITLTGVTAVDAVEAYGVTNAVYASGDTDTDGKLDVGETWNYTASYTVTQDDLDGKGGGDGDIDNVATGDSNETLPDSDDAVVELVYNPAINVTKDVKAVDAAGNLLADKAGDVIDYTIKIANTGNITLTGVAVTDTVEAYGATVATYASGDADGDGKLDVGETWTFDASYTLTQDDLDGKGGGNSLLDNVGTGDTAQTDPDSDSETVPLVYDPKIDLEKLVSVDSTNGINGTFVDADSDATNPDNSFLGPLNVNVGTDVWFKVVLDNTGNITLTDVDVIDENTTEGAPGPVFDLMVDGYLTLNAVTNFGATLSGDVDNDHQLDVDEVWTITYNQDFDPGQHINTASVTTGEGATDTDDAFYYSLVNQGPGVRTPGFWQNMNNGGQFWDGITGNEKNAGQTGFAEGELLYAVDSDGPGDGNAVDAIVVDGKGKIVNGGTTAGLLIGDYNMNGVTDGNEDTIFISYNDARTLINANNSQMSNGTVKLGRDVVATWLNYLSGNNIGESTDTESPKHFLDDAIDWFQKYAGKDGDTSSTDTFDVLNIAAKNNMTSAGWLAKIDGEHTGGDLHNALDHYNNDGKTEDGGTMYAHDTDDATFMAAMSALQSSGGSGGGAEDSGLLQTQQMIMI